MNSVIIATNKEDFRLSLYEALAHLGCFPDCISTWSETIRALTESTTQWMLVDQQFIKDAALLHALAESLPHRPKVHILASEKSIRSQLPNLSESLRTLSQPSPFTVDELELIPFFGWGPAGYEYLGRMAKSHLPIRIYGERGTEKESLARMIHRLRRVPGEFIIVPPGQEVHLDPEQPGTVFLQHLDKHGLNHIQGIREHVVEHGWQCIAGSRQLHSDDRDGDSWVHIKLKPLRECPKDIRPLSKHFLESYRRRLGIPKRRIHGKLWALMERYPWPGNRRELESFIVQAVTSARGMYITPKTLPPAAVDLLKSGYKTATATQSYELMVEERLRPVVDHYQPSQDTPSLYRLVMDATERALIRLVLNHNGGNQKTAASRLGVARNTLRNRMDRLDPYGEANS